MGIFTQLLQAISFDATKLVIGAVALIIIAFIVYLVGINRIIDFLWPEMTEKQSRQKRDRWMARENDRENRWRRQNDDKMREHFFGRRDS